MLAKTYGAAVVGIDAIVVEIEINATQMGDEVSVAIVGLPDAAIRESRQRIRSALAACGFMHPYGHTTVNLAPADVKKEGAAFDLPIALGMMAAVGQIEEAALRRTMILGELALDGRVRPLTGILPMAIEARDSGMDRLIVPAASAREAAIVRGVTVIAVDSLIDAVEYLKGEADFAPTTVDIDTFYGRAINPDKDFADIKGQELVRRALEVAAAGGHNVLLIGPPGTGKTMLAQRLPSILPLMQLDEALEVTRVHSIAGQLNSNEPLLVERPFRAPHHTVSDAGLLGGGSPPKPGEVSLAHNGILFLDEFPEFRRNALEVLRQPLESGDVTIARAAGTHTFPADFQLVAAMNPCPCGHYGSAQRQCRCTTPQVQRYRSRISGPLLDRIDLHVEVGALSEKELMTRPTGEDSETVRNRVVAARERQQRRFADSATRCNAGMTPAEIQSHCPLDEPSRKMLKRAIADLDLSARAYDRILRVARTLADLEDADIAAHHIAEAVQFRSLDRQLW